MSEHFTNEDDGKVANIVTVEDARKAHHLATADPEKDGLLTGPEHEEKYGLERAEASRAQWDAVHPPETDGEAAEVADEPDVPAPGE
jgi:hypothetical protein